MDPKVKGLLVGGVVVGAQRLLERGAVRREDLEVRLGPEALDLLERKIDPVTWYPVEAYTELADLVWEVEGGRDPDFMREKGQRWAARIYEQGVYPQLQYADSQDVLETPEEAVRRGRLIGSLVQTFWNFVQPIVDMDPDAPSTLRMCFEDAAAFPEANRFTTEGFLNHMVARGGGDARCTSERPSPDRVVFRLPLRLRGA